MKALKMIFIICLSVWGVVLFYLYPFVDSFISGGHDCEAIPWVRSFLFGWVFVGLLGLGAMGFILTRHEEKQK